MPDVKGRTAAQRRAVRARLFSEHLAAAGTTAVAAVPGMVCDGFCRSCRAEQPGGPGCLCPCHDEETGGGEGKLL